MQSHKIYEHTLRIPFPYTLNDAEGWIAIKHQELETNQHPVTFVIRDGNFQLLGSVGFDGMIIGQDRQAEIGYWLGENY